MLEIAQSVNPKNPYVISRGMKFPKVPEIMGGRIRASLRDGGYEAKEAECVLRNVKPDDTVIELGGGIGFMSTLAATKCGAKAVHTYEGNPRLIPYIRAVHLANDCTHVEINNALLGPRKGEVDFYIRKNILSSSMEEMEGNPPVETARIEVRNAKSEFKRIQPSVLICDIEGAEAHLIPQLPLDGLRCAILELHPQWIGPEGVNAVFQAFINAGLAYYPRFSNKKVVCFRRDWHVT
ncbi:FkbM family methyltransferase [Aestuariivita boseongensis]|uniref:FkbM family methyltransferase n=1 Tax=Aestuariivita boseongensis TaxID=1470562 RepID=UPI000681706F|nr:FkbM family methyltransferase [Aestuariivita boseongensis]